MNWGEHRQYASATSNIMKKSFYQKLFFKAAKLKTDFSYIFKDFSYTLQNTFYKRTSLRKCLWIFLHKNAIISCWKFTINVFGKKYKNNFVVHNNNKKISAWSLSSKWPVSICIVNQTTEETNRTNLSILSIKNLFKKVAKIRLQ